MAQYRMLSFAKPKLFLDQRDISVGKLIISKAC